MKLRTKSKKLLAMLLTFVMVLGMLPTVAFAADDRTVIIDVEVTYDFSPAVYGSTDYPLGNYRISGDNITKGSPAHLSNFRLEKKDGEDWDVPSGALQEGKYRYYAQLRVDDEAGATHVISSNPTLKVNGVDWIPDSNMPTVVYPSYSFRQFYGPEFTISEGTPTPIGSLILDGTSMLPNLVAGGTPSVLTIPTDAPYKIKKVQNTFSSDPAEIDVQGWADAENLDDGFVTEFEAGKTYLYTLVLEPKEGRSFASNATITITGITWDEKNNGDPNVSSEIADSSSPYPGCLFISGYYTVPEEGASTPIGSLTFDGTSMKPVAGGTPSVLTIPTDAPYKIKKVQNTFSSDPAEIDVQGWADTENMDDGFVTEFEAGKTYLYTLVLEPKEGQSFASNATITITGITWDEKNNGDPNVSSEIADSSSPYPGCLFISGYYTVPEEGASTPIGSLTFDGTSMKPVAGGTPSVLTIPTDAPYKIKKVQNTFSSDPAEIDVQGWADAENLGDGFVTSFEAGKTYLYTLVLEPKEGQSFASNATITITGITWDEKNNGDPNVSSEIADSSSPYPGCLFISAYYTVPEEGGTDTDEHTVTFKVVNGTWNGTDATDKTVTIEDGATLDTADIPTGMTANSGFTGGAWDTTPNTTTPITGNVTYTYTFTAETGTDTDEHTVTFKVVNGTWNGTDATDKTVTIEDGATLSASDIPTGMTANSGFTGGAWDTTPNTTTPITGNVTYTYTFTAETGTIPDEFTVTFKVVNGTWDGTNNADITVAVDDGATLDTNDIPTGMTANSGFTGGAWDTTPNTTTPITGNVTYTYTFTAETGTDTDEHTVTFKVVNGTWNGTDATDKTVTIEDGATLSASDIPTGMTANSGFAGGAWDTTPNTTTPITGNVTYTYTFTAETGTPGGDENEDEDEDEDKDGGIRIINRGKPNKGIRIGEPYEYAKPLPDRYKDTAETNPNTGLSLSLAPLAFIAFLLKKKK